jgi:integrase
MLSVSTGLRLGGALALRWVDIEFVAARLSVRRSVGVVKHKGQGGEIVLAAKTSVPGL